MRWTLPLEHLSIATLFIVVGLLMNLAQCVAFLLCRPINRTLYRKLAHFFQWAHWSTVSWIGFHYSGSGLRVFCSDEDLPFIGKEAAILIPNHRYSLDFLTTVMVPDQFGALGMLKAMQKNSIKFYPVIGWNFWFCENIFLARDAKRDIAAIETGIECLAKSKIPFWMTLYAEGTRFTAAKHERAEEVAREKNYAPLEHHLQVRPTGFVTIIKKLRETKGQPVMIYDMTIQQQRNENRSMIDILNFRAVTFTVFIKRIPLDAVPVDAEATWLRENYQEKDRRFGMMLKGQEDQLAVTDGVKEQHLPVPNASKYMTFFWMSTVLTWVVYKWSNWIYASIATAGLFNCTTCLLVMFPVCCILLTGAIIRTGDMKSSSSYGLKKSQ